MAHVEATASSVTLTITDPVELERLMTVLKRSNSTKVAAIRQQLAQAVLDAATSEVVTPEAVDEVVAGLEAMLKEQPPASE